MRLRAVHAVGSRGSGSGTSAMRRFITEGGEGFRGAAAAARSEAAGSGHHGAEGGKGARRQLRWEALLAEQEVGECAREVLLLLIVEQLLVLLEPLLMVLLL